MNARRSDPQYFLSEVRSSYWRPHLRRLVLARMYAYIAESDVAFSARPVVVVKEPTGSQAAGPLLDLLPQSKLLFLLRDGRDVLDSEIDAVQRGGWLARQFGSEDVMNTEILVEFARAQAYRWVSRTRYVASAYERHPQQLRKLVRYEDLRTQTEPVLRDILDWLGLDYDLGAVREHVRRLTFEEVPADQRGPGKFNRSAQPGAWKDNLSRPVLDAAVPIMAAELARYGYET